MAKTVYIHDSVTVSIMPVPKTVFMHSIFSTVPIESSFSIISSLKKSFQSSYQLISSLKKSFQSSYQLISKLMYRRLGSYDLVAKLRQLEYGSYNLVTNLFGTVLNNYDLISRLKKTWIKSHSLIACLGTIIRACKRDHLSWVIRGSITTGTQIGGTKVFGGPTVLQKVYIHLKNTGSSGSTIIDINKNGVSIFANPADRPILLFSDGNNQAEAEIDNIKLSESDIISVDIDQVAVGAQDLSVVTVVEPFTGFSPEIEEIQLLDDNFRMGNKQGWRSNKTRIRIRFNISMDKTVTPTFYITDQEDQSTPVITTSGWSSTRCSWDTYTTGLMDLSSGYSGKFLLSVETAKDLYGTVMKRYASEIEIIHDWYLITCEREYSNVKDVEFIIDCRTAKLMRFSLDGSIWGSWVNYENKYEVDITSASLGGSNTEELKRVYIQFKDGEVQSTGEYYYEIGYYYSAIDFTSHFILGDIHTTDEMNRVNQMTLRWRYGSSAETVPMEKTNIYVDTVLEKAIPHYPYIHSGFELEVEPVDERDIIIETGSYYDDDCIKRSIVQTTLLLSDFAPLPTTGDRIDLVYIDFADNTIKISQGTEGNTEDNLQYRPTSPLFEYDSSKKYPVLPDLKMNAFNLYYIYIKYKATEELPDPKQYIAFNMIGRCFERMLRYTTSNLEDGAHTIKIEIVDKASRTAYAEYTMTAIDKKKLGKIKAYPSDADRTAGTNEITSGEIHNYTTLYYRIEGVLV